MTYVALVAFLLAAAPALPRLAQDGALATTPEAPIVKAGDSVEAPKKVRHVSPEYPDDLLNRQVMGLVFLDCVIGIDGRMERVELIAGSAGLNEAAIAAVRQWTYMPSSVDGRPVRVAMPVALAFSVSSANLESAWLKALRYTDPRIRRAAVPGVAAFGKGAVEPLIDALSDDDALVRGAAARALGGIGGNAKKAIPALQRATTDKDAKVRDAAAAALEKVR